MEKDHSDQACPPEGTVSDAEKGILNKKAKRVQNGLNKRDLDKLTDGELRMLPLKDFWDPKKKEWKKSTAGIFGKQNSTRMKRIFGESKFQWKNLTTILRLTIK